MLARSLKFRCDARFGFVERAFLFEKRILIPLIENDSSPIDPSDVSLIIEIIYEYNVGVTSTGQDQKLHEMIEPTKDRSDRR